ncbi:MAG: 2-hydroxy-3-oxopropionate reductase, partial [Tannerella sp.]|nr:2-hydroxy-3-oxopropionate reductase [Tannerella sp.]
VASQSEVVITMLPNSPDVKDVVLGDNGILAGAVKGLTVIDMSSIAPIVSRELCAILEQAGCDMLDAPVSGGEPKAIDGTLSVMVGGKEDVFNKYADLLKVMAASVVRVGDIGAGNIAKLCNQLIVALNISAVSEALMLAKKAEVDPELVYKAIRGGLAGSTVLDAKAPLMLNRQFKPGFRIDLHIKDMNNVLETSHNLGIPLPLSAAVMEMLQALKADGLGNEDHSSIVKYYEKISNLRLGD